MHRKSIVLMVLIAFSALVQAGDTLRYTLEECRQMALNNSATARLQQEELLVAKYNRQAALAAMFPRVSANAGYMYNSRKPHLLADQMEFSQGTAHASSDGNPSFTWSDGSWFGQWSSTFAGTILEQPILDLASRTGNVVANAYQRAYDMLTLDLQHIFVAQVGVVQPIYVGGRLIQLYNISKSAEKIAVLRSEGKQDDMIFKVDEAYWRMVSVAHKKALAEQYHALLVQLEKDVQEAVNEGLATQSDLLKVATKRGDADVKKLQAENGLTLSRMALAQVCGLPLSELFDVDDSELTSSTLPASDIDAESYVNRRSEIQLLEEVEKIAKSSAKLVSAGLQPNIIASANYIYSKPNAENGLSSKWDGKGFFSAGVVVNVPIAHADDILRLKAAKHAAKVATLKVEETRELLTLQTTQANQKLMEAQQKIAMARMNKNNAEEVLRMARESYDAGMITASDLMMAQTQWLSAASELVDAEVEAKTKETELKKYMREL